MRLQAIPCQIRSGASTRTDCSLIQAGMSETSFGPLVLWRWVIGVGSIDCDLLVAGLMQKLSQARWNVHMSRIGSVNDDECRCFVMT